MRIGRARISDGLTGKAGHAASTRDLRHARSGQAHHADVFVGWELMSQEANDQTMPTLDVSGLSPWVEETLMGLDSLVVQLERLIENRSHESLHQPGQDGRWGVVEVLCHLRDWEIIIHDRILQIVEGERPEFDDPDVMMWSLERDYGSQDAHTVFQELSTLRRSLIARLRETDEANWERTGVMGGHGEMTLGEFLTHVVEHDQRYLADAREAVA